MSKKYLTFDCYGTLLNENNTYDEIEKLARKIGVDSTLARQRFQNYQDDCNNMHPYLDYDLLTRNNLIHLDYQFGLEHQFEKYFVDVLIAHQNLKPFPEVINTLQTLIDRNYQLILCQILHGISSIKTFKVSKFHSMFGLLKMFMPTSLIYVSLKLLKKNMVLQLKITGTLPKVTTATLSPLIK